MAILGGGGPLNSVANAVKKKAQDLGITKKADKAGVPSVTTGKPTAKEISSQTSEAPIMTQKADGHGNNVGPAGKTVPATNIPNSQPTQEVAGAAGKAKDKVRDNTDGSPPKSSGSGWTGIPIPNAPTRPAFSSQDNDNGTIKQQLSAAHFYGPASAGQADTTTANIGTAGKALTARATDTGPSPWLKMQLQQQGIEEQNAQGNATAANAGATAGSRTALASHGGLSSGAMERVQKSGANDLALQRQTIANQGQQSRLGLGIADENTKTGLLSNAAGLEQGLSQFNAGQTNQGSQFNAGQRTGTSQFNAGQENQAEQFDIGNALGDTQAHRNDDLAYYQQQMADRAAAISGNAIGQAGSGKNKPSV